MRQFIDGSKLCVAKTQSGLKNEGWDGEEIHSRNDFTMVTQESGPKLSGLGGWRQAAGVFKSFDL